LRKFRDQTFDLRFLRWPRLAESNVTVWRASICLSYRHTHSDSPGGSMQRSQRTFWPDN